MVKIDIHTHILPLKMPRYCERFGYPGFIEVREQSFCQAQMIYDDGRHFRDITENAWSPERRMEEMTRDEVTLQVLSPVPIFFYYWAKPKDNHDIARFLNDHIAKVVERFPNSFRGLGTVPLQDERLAILELNRCVRDLKLCGVEIGTHVNGCNLDDSRLLPFFQEAEKLGAAIFVHPWEVLGGERLQKYWFPWLIGMPTETAIAMAHLIFGGVLDRCPKLRVAFAHGGGTFLSLIGRMSHGFSVRPDLCATGAVQSPEQYLGRFYVDSIVHTKQMLEQCLKLFGKERILLGSDYPFPLGESRPGALIDSLGLSEGDRNLLLHGNASRWLGLA